MSLFFVAFSSNPDVADLIPLLSQMRNESLLPPKEVFPSDLSVGKEICVRVVYNKILAIDTFSPREDSNPHMPHRSFELFIPPTYPSFCPCREETNETGCTIQRLSRPAIECISFLRLLDVFQ